MLQIQYQIQQAGTIVPSVTLHYAKAVCLQESYGIYPPFEQAMNLLINTRARIVGICGKDVFDLSEVSQDW